MQTKLDILQGTLDLMLLRTLAVIGTGEKQLVAETEYWERLAAVMGRMLASGGPDE